MIGIQRWSPTRPKREGRAAPAERELKLAAHWAQLEVVRTMPFAGRHGEDLMSTGMCQAARQSVQDSAALLGAISDLDAVVPLPAHLEDPVRAALAAVGRLARLRESWMRHRPAVDELSGLPGVTLLQRVERGEVRGAVAPGWWPEDEEAQAAMQMALLPLGRLYRATGRVTGQFLFPEPPVGG